MNSPVGILLITFITEDTTPMHFRSTVLSVCLCVLSCGCLELLEHCIMSLVASHFSNVWGIDSNWCSVLHRACLPHSLS